MADCESHKAESAALSFHRCRFGSFSFTLQQTTKCAPIMVILGTKFLFLV